MSAQGGSEAAAGPHWLPLALALALGPAIVNGFARFSYALILPSMQASLGWSYASAGWLNGANAVGYLVGALAAPALLRAYGARTTFIFCNVATGVLLLAVAASSNYWLLVGFRGIAGIAGSLVFISGSTLAASISNDPRRNAACIGIYFAGIGAAMLVAGLALPPFFALRGDDGWPVAWLMLGIASLAAAWPAAWAARMVKGSEGTRAGARGTVQWRRFLPSLAAYFGFGLGYIGYMTFIIALLRTREASPLDTMLVWGVLALAMLASPYLWRGPLSRWSGSRVLGLGNLASGVGALLALAGASEAWLVASAAVFGASFLSTASAITAFSKQELPPAAWGPAVAGFTVAFAAGQIIGPVMTGWIADVAGGLGPGLAVSAAILLATSGLVLLQRVEWRPGR